MLTRSGLGVGAQRHRARRARRVVGLRGAGHRRHRHRHDHAARHLGLATTTPGDGHPADPRVACRPRRPDPCRRTDCTTPHGSVRAVPRSSIAATIRRSGSTPIRSPRTRRRAIESTIPTRRRGVFDVGPLDIERIDPFWLTVGTRRTGQVSSVDRPSEGVRPARPPGRRPVGRERIGDPPRLRRPDVRLRVDARVRRRRRPAHDPLADHRPRGNADDPRTRRGAPS